MEIRESGPQSEQLIQEILKNEGADRDQLSGVSSAASAAVRHFSKTSIFYLFSGIYFISVLFYILTSLFHYM
jgi:hypothetical protein